MRHKPGIHGGRENRRICDIRIIGKAASTGVVGGLRAGTSQSNLVWQRSSAGQQPLLPARGYLHPDQRHALETDAARIPLRQNSSQAIQTVAGIGLLPRDLGRLCGAVPVAARDQLRSTQRGRSSQASKKRGQSTGPNPTDRAKSGTQVVLVATAEDLPLGATICAANQQDAAFVGEALATIVIPPALSIASNPMPPHQEHQHQEQRDSRGKLTRASLRAYRQQLSEGADVRAMPYLRADGNFAKDPSRAKAKARGFRLWAPDKHKDQSRRGLGIIRSSVERAHASINQFGRIFRRLDRDDRWYLGWVQLACCIIFMRRGFFP